MQDIVLFIINLISIVACLSPCWLILIKTMFNIIKSKTCMTRTNDGLSHTKCKW